ncbi:MAG: ribonuclease HII [Lachnospiraceae bacterium]|nr:ribonuclease HII [Lachnospiraceae bacterium]
MSNESVKSIKERLLSLDFESGLNLLKELEQDERKSVQAVCKSYRKKYDAYVKELNRIQRMKDFDENYSQGNQYVCGVDEVGRGPLAGPVVTAAVIMPKDSRILYVNDSKKLSAKKREELYEIITREAVTFSLGIKDHHVIDEVNIRNATIMAMTEAVNNLNVAPGVVIIDALSLPEVDIPQKNVIKGDEKSYNVACASIVAKVTRDRMMEEFAKKYPNYGFEKNMGYGTSEHIEGLKKYGKCEIHRDTFIKNFIN